MPRAMTRPERIRREARCAELSQQHRELQKEADLYLHEYYRENDKAEELFDKADMASNEARAERLWTEWQRQYAKRNVAWNRHKTANDAAKRMIKAWSRLCGRRSG